MDIRKRFWIALACYAALALVASQTFRGPWLWALWVFFGGLALKTWIAAFRRE